jgi:transposase
MILGVDVHKHTHTAALLDPPGGEVSTLTFANSADGIARLRDWLAERGGSEAVVGIENAAGYGRLLAAALIAAGHAVLTVPSWRTHRDRDLVGPGKSDAGDATAIAEVVLRKRSGLGPAAEPELVRATALLESLRRQSVAQRTQAIQRLRATWTQVNPEPSGRSSISIVNARCGGCAASASAPVWPSGPPPAASASSHERPPA